MDRLIIENVRCFRGTHEVPLAPLTILVGENSTGKSTLLAMARLAWPLAWGERVLDFNEEPFLLGSYDQIATSRSVPGDSMPQFSLSSQWAEGNATFGGVFSSQKGQPALMDWWMEGSGYRIDVGYRSRGAVASLKVKTPSGEVSFDGEALPEAPMGLISHWAVATLSWLESGDEIFDLPFAREDIKLISDLSYVPYNQSIPYAFSPIRTRPRRTYDPVQEIRDPEGSHVPMVLANAAFEGGVVWESLKQSLEEFGVQSGLYQGIEVRRLGSSESDPFQLQFRVGRSLVNLVDIGYGVSQILPILVECLRVRDRRSYLLQQPEVHLHPKAQAELASFLALLAKQQKKRFLVETHSDYLVDRIRMDIRDGKNGLQPEDVSLLYFERAEGTVKIHRLILDRFGNIENAPPGYRKFILEEERRFLGI